MKKDLATTGLSQAFVLLSIFACYKLAILILGDTGFSEYAISRRVIALLQPLILLGLGVGVPRYIAHEAVSSKEDRSGSYFLSALIIVLIVSAAFVSAASFLPHSFAGLMFGDQKYSGLSVPISLILLGNALTALCYAYYRGKISFFKANFIAIINMGIIPLASFFMNNSLADILMFNGLAGILFSVLYIFFILAGSGSDFSGLITSTKALLVFGTQRVPGELGMAAMLSLPALIALHNLGIEKAGYIAFGVSIINAVGQIFSPIGLVFLPIASRLFAGGQKDLLKKYSGKMILLSLCVSAILLAGYLLFGKIALRHYMGNDIPDLYLAVLAALVSGFGYSVFASLRSFIDALCVNAVNTVNILLCLALFSAISMFTKTYLLILLNFSFSLSLLGALSIISVSLLARDKK